MLEPIFGPKKLENFLLLLDRTLAMFGHSYLLTRMD